MRASARARQFFGEARGGQVNSRHYSARQNANLSLSLFLGSCIHKKCTHGSCISTCHVDNGVCLFIFNSYGTRSRRVNTIFVTSRVRC